MTAGLTRYFDLTGKTALITGATRGIGFGLAAGLAEAGAHVILNGRDSTKLATAQDRLQQAGITADILCFDVRDQAAVAQAIRGFEAG